jgi:peptide/nickel transport system ATP-binding protein
VRHMSQRVAVMYLGKIVEIGDRDTIYRAPAHPYTVALLSAVPDVTVGPGEGKDRIRLQGDVPTPVNPPSGCRFRTRCWKAQEICAQVEPPLSAKAAGQLAACHFPEPPSAGTV